MVGQINQGKQEKGSKSVSQHAHGHPMLKRGIGQSQLQYSTLMIFFFCDPPQIQKETSCIKFMSYDFH